MHYFSTNRKAPHVSFRDALLNGQPDDKGLYFPSEIPRLAPAFLSDLRQSSNEQIAFDVIRPYVEGEIPTETLFDICTETVNFEFPLVPVTPNISALELFHGPTLAFKDVGARFMSRCLQYFSSGKTEKTIVIVATSGDTGGAVAAGFHNVEGIEVVILYPKGKVSRVQELQLTTLGGNVTTLELHGNFDDCQALAKQALADTDLQSKVDLTSANSINVARWLPQQFFYFYALKQWSGAPPVVSVPSGNFGNLASGILAHTSGLPVKKFIAACNANDVVPRFLLTGDFQPKSSIATLSNAMDVGSPSNFVRILEIFNNKLVDLKEKLESVSVSDADTAATIREVYEKAGYILDPHGAVGYRALADHLELHPDQAGIFLETAHPVKFEPVNEIIGTSGPMPESVNNLLLQQKHSIEMDVNYDDLKSLLLSKI
ncbi:MAG: threonine synthase [Pyrinomonadaceae bacterium]